MEKSERNWYIYLQYSELTGGKEYKVQYVLSTKTDCYN